MAKRRVKRGRGPLLLVVLLGFVLVATGVIARRTYGIGQARQVREMERRRQALEADRMRIESEIRDASSRARLAPIAQGLGLHVPSPDQVIMLRPPARGDSLSHAASVPNDSP